MSVADICGRLDVTDPTLTQPATTGVCVQLKTQGQTLMLPGQRHLRPKVPGPANGDSWQVYVQSSLSEPITRRRTPSFRRLVTTPA